MTILKDVSYENSRKNGLDKKKKAHLSSKLQLIHLLIQVHDSRTSLIPVAQSAVYVTI